MFLLPKIMTKYLILLYHFICKIGDLLKEISSNFYVNVLVSFYDTLSSVLSIERS